MKQRILVLKRAPDLDVDMFDIPQPEDGKVLRVKAMTYPILLPQGVYVLVGWDMDASRPGILILNHTLFPALRRWVRDYMQPIEDNVFEITSTRIGGVVEHNLTSLGRSMVLQSEDVERMNEYLNALLGEAEVEVRQ